MKTISLNGPRKLINFSTGYLILLENMLSRKQNALYAQLQKTASAYGDFIDSRPLTEYPASGGDGVHYWGKEGTRIAKQWSQDVFSQIQALK